MAEEERRNRDIVLVPNEWMHVKDQTKGEVNVYVGPTKTTLGDGDQMVVFDEHIKRFVEVERKSAVQAFKTAPEGYYIVLKNPAYTDKGEQKHPTAQGKATSVELSVGRKVNIPGPVSFPLYPGQMAKVIKGHNLRSNQYLLVRVYDDEAARANWNSAIIKPQAADGTEQSETPSPSEIPDLTMGKLLVIKGTEVAFYIPPTGIEVVPDGDGNLIRGAVTLETLEYCLLRDENGGKRYERGPKVVFPQPTETFADREVERDGKKQKTRKFRAIELNENSGIYIKVIADYKDEETGEEHHQGEELFITGKRQMIYFPRGEHALVKYGDQEIHYGIAIPSGEARYVLDRNKGEIDTIKGPRIFLPDPRTQVVVRRLLDFKTCSILYPGNTAAVEHNASVAGVDVSTYMSSAQSIADAQINALMAAPGAAGAAYSLSGLTTSASIGNAGVYAASANVSDVGVSRGIGGPVARGFSGETIVRKSNFSEPRTITLPTKYDGAVSCDIWSGYAMMLVSKSGRRRVVQGPCTVLLEYDEHPQILALSRGKPKTTDNILRTAYLLTTGNKVSDIIEVETSDFCKLRVKVSYRVNFTGTDLEKWFSVENYTKFLCDHLRSKLRSATKKIGVEKFYASAEDFVRDVTLGSPAQSNGRPGTKFEENGMHVYDVEVLGVELDNREIAQDLATSQKEVIKHALTLASSRRGLEFTKESEAIKQETTLAKTETARKEMELKQEELTSRLELELATIAANSKAASEKSKQVMAAEEARIEVEKITLAATKAVEEQKLEIAAKQLEQKKDWLRSEVQGVVDQAKAIAPELIAALNAFGERAAIEKMVEAMSPVAMIKGVGIPELVAQLLNGTSFAKHLLEAKNGNGNGAKPSQPRA